MTWSADIREIPPAVLKQKRIRVSARTTAGSYTRKLLMTKEEIADLLAYLETEVPVPSKK